MTAGPGADAPLPTSPAALEREIDVRRQRLAATIDELSHRAKPQVIARRGVAGARAKAEAAVRTPDGQLRTERIAAIGGAVVAVTGLLVWLRRRR